ncbi:transporter, outer membrane receptor (OMR) family [Hyphomonas neptunium ATCC 15444]|uniref:Transporter, outer membrane receptor (OMR) family n=2 Tax=Hyphomonas TaxID=85 RepID=Q0C1R8_HYPNA|nr:MULTISPECIES: TonB-dependent receptor [Hyphomonas]ABI75893.1 transporter, outer membrane receptor (OMR) family [Hyphomonas neptunium ATCC 15444]KCZ92590.1 outer membrane receptor (OMR) family protein [Hyphomonas hirschiana VP5]
MKHSLRAYLMACAVGVSGLMMGPHAAAQEPAVTENEDEAASIQEKIVVTGARGRPRTIADSAVPIDVLSSDEIIDVPFTDANDILKTLVPSYSLARQPISDGGTFIRPASLRGMPTDKTLVLVNSKRRHRAALVSIGGSGTQGPDIATIPAIALKSVEVLRDGAAAQYGSDAIAGVINFILKDAPDGAMLTAEMGQYYEGDGFQTTFAANFGAALGEAGFFNLSGEASDQSSTHRGVQYCEDYFCLDPTDPRYSAPSDAYYEAMIANSQEFHGISDAQQWGQPNADAIRMFLNTGYELSPNASLYAFGNYSKSSADGTFFYRYPGNGTIEDLREADGSIYSPLEKFPGGFAPRFIGDVIDYSFVGGLKGEIWDGFTYDLSGRLGNSKVKYTLTNTINPSMGPDSPTEFQPGDLINEEIQFQADFGKEFELGLAEPVLFAFGLSYLDETYEIVQGAENSYAAGPYAVSDPWGLCTGEDEAAVPTAAGALVIANGSTLNCADSDDPVYQIVGVGANGFPGYSPEFSGEYARDSFAAYADVSADITDRLFLQGAVRFEDYSDFDSEVVGKVAGRFNLTDAIALRGSLGTGFRAPSPGQQGTTNVSTRLPDGVPVATGLFPAGGPIAAALGAEPLAPEKSVNYTLGATGSFDAFSLSIDYYRIDLEDRINAISTQTVSTNPGAGPSYDNYLSLVEAGVVGAETIGGVFYFQNLFDTKTEGVDVVATYALGWANGASTSLTGSVNYNKTEFDGDVPSVFNAESQYDFLEGTPKWRGVFTAKHETGPFSLLARANYYGSSTNSNNSGLNGALEYQEFDPVIQVDLEATYTFDEMYRISLGARNIFDQYPDESTLRGDSCCGRLYLSDSVVDWQGGYYYLKGVVEF